jgi:hypothetical protein
VLLETAHFVPRATGAAAAELLRKQGIRIRARTNSLASNDVLAAFAGHSKYRERLVAAGVELYEPRPDAGGRSMIRGPSSPSRTLNPLRSPWTTPTLRNTHDLAQESFVQVEGEGGGELDVVEAWRRIPLVIRDQFHEQHARVDVMRRGTRTPASASR